MKTGYGTILVADSGLLICHECGTQHTRLMTHVRQKHYLTAREYKRKWGLDVSKGLCTPESSDKSRAALARHPELVSNLIERSVQHRFTKGHKGRTKELVSAQTETRLKQLHTLNDADQRKQRAYKLGKSNQGNYVRWKRDGSTYVKRCKALTLRNETVLIPDAIAIDIQRNFEEGTCFMVRESSGRHKRAKLIEMEPLTIAFV